MYFTSISTGQTTDCLHLREQCINAANGCQSVWNVVEDVCNISGNSVCCMQLYFECLNVCDFCSIMTLLGKQCSINKAYRANRTCLEMNKECVEDEVCNKQLSLYLKVCSVNKKCNMEECQTAMRFFYQNMPFEVAQMMTFCDCTQPDESCHRAKELLHGKPCAVTAVPPPSCLNVIHMCEENELCRKKYTAFWSKCWRHVTKKCYDDEDCLETLIKDDMPCSANVDCKGAYISNWGTMLRVECTCQNVPPAEQSLCKLFHHMLHSKSCFSELLLKSIKMLTHQILTISLLLLISARFISAGFKLKSKHKLQVQFFPVIYISSK
uniref:GDNF family receptor alpha like n=1 Tax=Falco tinnunculus TaxID=100819 RepID=A0A8C4UUF6_FALTI